LRTWQLVKRVLTVMESKKSSPCLQNLAIGPNRDRDPAGFLSSLHSLPPVIQLAVSTTLATFLLHFIIILKRQMYCKNCATCDFHHCHVISCFLVPIFPLTLHVQISMAPSWGVVTIYTHHLFRVQELEISSAESIYGFIWFSE